MVWLGLCVLSVDFNPAHSGILQPAKQHAQTFGGCPDPGWISEDRHTPASRIHRTASIGSGDAIDKGGTTFGQVLDPKLLR